MDLVELLIGIAEIAIALAGFTGVVVAFGSRSVGSWHPGDRLRLAFLLEASLTAAGFALIALLVLSVIEDRAIVWTVMSSFWAVYMSGSLWNSHRRISTNSDTHGDVDKVANRFTGGLFWVLVLLQLANVIFWQAFPPFLAAIMLNLAGAAMQFARLIRSAFRE